METVNGPLIISLTKKSTEAEMCVDLSNCENNKFVEFVFSLLTEHHSNKVTIDCDLNQNGIDAKILIAWEHGGDREANKVITSITSVCHCLCE